MNFCARGKKESAKLAGTEIGAEEDVSSGLDEGSRMDIIY